MERLLSVSLCLLMFTGKTFGDNVDVKSKEDEDVILPCSFKVSLTEKRFDWKKDSEDVFLYENGKPSTSIQHVQFKDRVSYFHEQLDSGNASIIIKKAKVSDSGTYTCHLIDSGESYEIKLTVGSVAKPSVIAVNETTTWALLRCKVIGAFPEPSLVWYNSAGKDVTNKEPQVIKNNDRYDVILETMVTETDHYTCVATQEELHHQLKETTYINIGGAVAKPSVNTVNQTSHWSLLRCEVIGAFPKPSVAWYNTAGKNVTNEEPQVSEKDGAYDVILHTTVTKTDGYTCIATQEELKHQAKKFTYIHIAGSAEKPNGDGKRLIMIIIIGYTIITAVL